MSAFVLIALLMGQALTPHYRVGEIVRLSYAPERQAVVTDVEFDRGGYLYTVVPAELFFRDGAPATRASKEIVP